MGLRRHGVPPSSEVPDAGPHRPEGDSSAHSSYTSVPPFPLGQALLFQASPLTAGKREGAGSFSGT